MVRMKLWRRSSPIWQPGLRGADAILRGDVRYLVDLLDFRIFIIFSDTVVGSNYM